jgi:hypothetical protein
LRRISIAFAAVKSGSFWFVFPDDNDGALTLQIITRRVDGATVKSLLSGDSTPKIRHIEK